MWSSTRSGRCSCSAPSALDPGIAGDLKAQAARVLDENGVSPQSRRELEAVVYALRMMYHS